MTVETVETVENVSNVANAPNATKDNGKFLFLDTADAAYARDRVPEAGAEPCEEMGPQAALAALVDILTEGGFDPVVQLTGYLMSEDPTYLPEDTEARAIVRRVGRDKLLETLIELYLEHHLLKTEPLS